MKKIAVFVDAGYFWVQVSNLIAGMGSKRTNVHIDYEQLHQLVLSEVAQQFPKCNLLRVYWYDGPTTYGNKAPDHQAISDLDDFKLKLGTRNGHGQQKGVDGLIIADLIQLTIQKAIDHALLVTGDADITPGVIAAQALGLRVHLLSIGTADATSPVLSCEADKKHIWSAAEISRFATQSCTAVAHQNPPSPHSSSAPPPTIADIATQFFTQNAHLPSVSVLINNSKGMSLNPDTDRRMLTFAKQQLNNQMLSSQEKSALRKEVIRQFCTATK